MLGLIVGLAAVVANPAGPGPYVAFGPSHASECSTAAQDRSEVAGARIPCDLALAGALTDQEHVATLVNRGALALLVGDTRAAEADFDAAIARAPAQPEAWLNKALSLQSRGASEAAIVSFNRAISLGTANPELALLGRGLAHEANGNLTEAYADLTQARSIAPTWLPPKAELARYQIKR